MTLRIADVTKSFRSGRQTINVLSDVNLMVADGECIALIGPSGIGKSTLVSLVAGYSTVSAGTITCDDIVVTRPGPDRIVVTQQDTLFPWLTVLQNARYPATVGHFRFRGSEISNRADALLHRFGLWSHGAKYPSTLSGGERRRVELVRAFAVAPKVLLMDEPYSAADEVLRFELGQHLLEWRRESPAVCTLIVTHDIEEACFLADRVIIMGGRPATIVAEVQTGFGPIRNASLRFQSDFEAVVHRVRCQYNNPRSIKMDGER